MKYWPFSLSGNLVLLTSIYLLGTAIPRSNPYGIILAVILLLVILLLLALVLFHGFAVDPDRFQWNFLSGTAPSRVQRKNVSLEFGFNPPPLIRYCFILRGDLYNERELLYHKNLILTFIEKTQFHIDLPLPGFFHCRGRLYVSDILGFIRFPLTPVLHREIPFHPPLMGEPHLPRPSSAEKKDETIKTSTSNPERVLMRDYQPGDLVRDINWKASSKSSTIFTRIAPDSTDSANRITIYIRPEGTDEKAEPQQSALLLGLKSLSETLISTFERDYPDSILTIVVGTEIFSSDQEDLRDRAIPYITNLGGRKSGSLSDFTAGAFVCTTSADRDLILLKETFGGRVLIVGTSRDRDKKYDLIYSCFKGNSLPGRSLLRRYFNWGTEKMKKTADLIDREALISVGIEL